MYRLPAKKNLLLQKRACPALTLAIVLFSTISFSQANQDDSEVRFRTVVRGLVVDKNGNPQPRVPLVLISVSTGERVSSCESRQQVTTGLGQRNSNFEFVDFVRNRRSDWRVPPGSYEIVIFDVNSNSLANWSRSAADKGVPVGRFEGETIEGLEIVYEGPPGIEVTGLLADESGKPVPDASIEFGYIPRDWTYAASTKTNADGSYEIGGLMAARHYVKIEHPDFPPFKEFVTLTESTQLDFVAEQIRSLHGTVIDGLTGRPIERIETATGRYWDRLNFIETNSPIGLFDLGTMEDTSLYVRARGYGLVGFEKGELFDHNHQPDVPVDVRLFPAMRIEGVVTDEDGRPIPNTRIYGDAYPPPPDRMSHLPVFGFDAYGLAMTDSSGRFLAENVPVNTARIWAYDGRHLFPDREVDLKPGDSRTIDFRYGGGCELEFEVREDGRLIAQENLFVFLVLPSQPERDMVYKNCHILSLTRYVARLTGLPQRTTIRIMVRRTQDEGRVLTHVRDLDLELRPDSVRHLVVNLVKQDHWSAQKARNKDWDPMVGAAGVPRNF